MNELLKNHVHALYKLLGHEGYYSRVGALDTVTKDYEDTYVKGEEEVIEYARRWNGRRNVFISRGARNKDGSIARVSVCSYDLDPNRPKGVASTNEQHNNALEAGRLLLRRYPGGYLSSSGNGCLVIYRLQAPIVDFDAYYAREGVLIEELNALVKDLDVKVDSTNYDQAVIKLLGTQSTKGSPEQRRVAKFIDFPLLPYKRPLLLSDKLNQIKIEPKAEPKRSEGDPVKRLQDAATVLKSLSKGRADDYENWLKVGMSLKEFGNAGLTLWETWSKQSSKFQEGICEEKWKTFEETPAVTLGTLRFWAEQDKAISGPAVFLASNGAELCSSETYFAELFSPKRDSDKPVRTGFERLDKALGPFPTGELVTFAARSGFGKSTFACTVAEQLRRSGYHVLIFSTEMSQRYIMDKFLSIACEIPLEEVVRRCFTEDGKRRIMAYEAAFKAQPIDIDDTDRPSLDHVKMQAQRYKPDLLIIDHITHIETHWDKIAEYAKGLKELAKASNICILNLAEMNEPPRNPKTGEEMPSLRSDLAGTQQILRLSAGFVFLSNAFQVKGRYQPVQFNIAKNRYGISGQVVELTIDKITSKFLEGRNDVTSVQ